LWLIPASPSSESAKTVIEELTKSETQSPIFSPHITLLHPIPKSTPVDEIISLLSKAVKQAGFKGKKLSLFLQPAAGGSHYYQSVLSPVHANPALSQLRKSCEDGFKWEGKPYFPHLSLLYGDLTSERREELAKKVNDEMDLTKIVEIGEIAIVDCTGTADEWKTVGTVELE
jgi:2'-5' RNA ligase